MEDIMKIVKSLEESGLLIKDVREIIKNEAKKQKWVFLGLFLGTLGASLLGNVLKGGRVKTADEGIVLTNFSKQKYYQNEPKFNGVSSRNNLSKVKDGAYIINLDEYGSIGTHWIALYVNAKNVRYVDSFGVDIFQKRLENLLETKYNNKYL